LNREKMRRCGFNDVFQARRYNMIRYLTSRFGGRAYETLRRKAGNKYVRQPIGY
jgi:hypothetical protein